MLARNSFYRPPLSILSEQWKLVLLALIRDTELMYARSLNLKAIVVSLDPWKNYRPNKPA